MTNSECATNPQLKGSSVVINSAVSPYFISFFSAENSLIKTIYWDDQKSALESIVQGWPSGFKPAWLGGVTGPGYFSGLRLASHLLQTWHWCQDCPLVSVSLRTYLEHSAPESASFPYYAEAFGQYLWQFSAENTEPQLVLPNQDLPSGWAFLVSEEKKKALPKMNLEPWKNPEYSLQKILRSDQAKYGFLPLYQRSAVASGDS